MLLRCALALLALAGAARGTQVGEVATFAGSSSGYADGDATSAKFFLPFGPCVDPSGDPLYLTDLLNQVVRKISGGTVSTLAGAQGTMGYADGAGGAAQFKYPSGCAIDASGNVFVVDSNNHALRKVTPGGTVSTFVGVPPPTAASGLQDGTGSAALLSSPTAVAMDGAGNMYVTDSGNNAIRKVTAAGVVTTLAGNGTAGLTNGVGALATFTNPRYIAVDAEGTVLYISDYDNHAIRKLVIATGAVTTYAGSGTAGFTDGLGTSAQFYQPQGVALDAGGVVYVADRCVARRAAACLSRSPWCATAQPQQRHPRHHARRHRQHARRQRHVRLHRRRGRCGGIPWAHGPCHRAAWHAVRG